MARRNAAAAAAAHHNGGVDAPTSSDNARTNESQSSYKRNKLRRKRRRICCRCFCPQSSSLSPRSVSLLLALASLLLVTLAPNVVFNLNPFHHAAARFRNLGRLRNSKFVSTAGSHSVTPPLHPQGATIGTGETKTQVFWMLPDVKAESIKGVLLHFHGCARTGADFFTLPEDRVVAKAALVRGLAVLSPTSSNRHSGCWDERDAELLQTGDVVREWMDEVGMVQSEHELPIIGLGEASGGSFLFRAWKVLKFSAMVAYVTPKSFDPADIEVRNRGGDEEPYPIPPTAFVYLTFDDQTAKSVEENSDALVMAGIPTLVVGIEPHPFTAERCNIRLPELGDRRCEQLLRIFTSRDYSGLMARDGTYEVLRNTWGGEWDGAFQRAKLDADLESLKKRSASSALRAAAADKESAEAEGGVVAVPDTSFAGHSRLYAAVEQEINAAFGRHEMVAEKIDQVLDWLLGQAGIGAMSL